MSKIEELIQELCPDGVKYNTISKCVNKISNIKWTNEKECSYQYIDLTSVDRDTHAILETSHVDFETAPSRAKQIVKEGDILLGATRPMLKRYCMVTEEYDNQICSTGFCVLRAKTNIVLTRWLYHQIASTSFFNHVEKFQKGASYPAISDADVKAFIIPVPPLPVQEEIVRILDNFTELTAELTARKRQYEFYRDELLNIDCDKILFGEVATIVRGASPRPIKDYITDSDEGVNWIKIGDVKPNTKYITTTKEKITLEGAKKSRFVKQGDFILSNSMSFGRPYIIKKEGCIHDGWLAISDFNECYISDFLYHLLNSNMLQNVMKQKASNGGAVSNLNADIVKSLELPLVPIEKQKNIVAILDRFDSLCNDITTGLPAEIEARKKQYEYHRDKLLTFKRLEV